MPAVIATLQLWRNVILPDGRQTPTASPAVRMEAVWSE